MLKLLNRLLKYTPKDNVLDTLHFTQQLPPEYISIKDYIVPEKTNAQGEHVCIDYLLLSPDGLFVVNEVIDGSIISGNNAEALWTIYSNDVALKMVNPVRKVKSQIHVLSNYMSSKKITSWIDGIVFFSNKDCQLEYYSNNPYNVFDDKEELIDFLTDFSPKYPFKSYNKITKLLTEVINDNRP